MSKYIVKNCPGLDDELCAGDGENWSHECSCASNCLIKRIIAKCQEPRHSAEIAMFQEEILSLFDIEEQNMSKCKDKASE